jgi:hypothetical protein
MQALVLVRLFLVDDEFETTVLYAKSVHALY